MAENYIVGNNRLWYKSKAFKEGLFVTVDFTSPSLQEWGDLAFTEKSNGLYYLEFRFDEVGDWIATVYENGEKVFCQVYNVGRKEFGRGQNILG